MLSKKSLVISLSLLTLITTQADAGSKQYYKYYLKVRSANILWGIVGDHTYVCIKKKKKRHHKKDKTIRNYGCHAADGGIYRDAATYRTVKVKKNRHSRDMKKASIMTNHVHECTNGYQNKYAWDLTCHQNTNRMLFAIPRHPRLDNMAYIRGYKNGFTNTRLRFGEYGARGWSRCYWRTYGRVR